MTRTTIFALSLAAVFAGACQGRTALRPVADTPAGGIVSLTDRDLAPVDAFIGARNAQWILGDDVEVLASREYFGQNLTMTRASGLVERQDDMTGGETKVTLTFRGDPGAASVTTNPRVLIGTGLTVTARRTLVVHLMKTRDARRPVYLCVTARGSAARGRGDQVTERAGELVLGGEIKRGAGGAWTWTPFR